MFSPRQRGRPRLRGNCRLCLQVQCSRESWRQSGIKVASTKLTATQDSLGADCRHANRPVHCEEVAEMGVLKRHIYVEHQKSVTCFFFKLKRTHPHLEIFGVDLGCAPPLIITYLLSI